MATWRTTVEDGHCRQLGKGGGGGGGQGTDITVALSAELVILEQMHRAGWCSCGIRQPEVAANAATDLNESCRTVM